MRFKSCSCSHRSFFSYFFSVFYLRVAAVKARHKWHLIFAFTENQESNNAVLQATLHLFVHSWKYLIANEIEHPPNLKFIDIEIAKILKGAQHKMIFDVFHNISIPESGDGRYVQLNITDLVTEWFHNHDTSHGIVVKILSPRTGAQLSHQIVTLNADDLIRVSTIFHNNKRQ